MVEILASQVVSGLATGCVYALIALGFVLIFKATDVVNFAQGEFVMASGFISFTLLIWFGLPYWLVFFLTIALSGIMGVTLERVVVRPIMDAPIFSIVIATIGASTAMRSFAGAILGGFGSIPGAIVGGMLLGILENLSGYFFNAGIKQVSTYILLILVLVVRPSGLFGAAPVKRV